MGLTVEGFITSMEATCWAASRLDGQLILIDLRLGKTWTFEELEIFKSEDLEPGSRIHRDEDGRWYLSVDGHCYEMPPVALLRRLHDRGCEVPDELFSDVGSSPDERSAAPSHPPIRLTGDGSLFVVNRIVERLSKTRRAVVAPVIEAYPYGLTKDELKQESGHEGAVSVFKVMRRSLPLLRLVLRVPGKRGGGGYRCAWPEPWAECLATFHHFCSPNRALSLSERRSMPRRNEPFRGPARDPEIL